MAVESPPCLVVVLFTELPDQNTMINNSKFGRSMLTCPDAQRIGNQNFSKIIFKLVDNPSHFQDK